MRNCIEATIRDHLAEDLGVLEAGLHYLDKEKYVPHPIGTRGFIDIVARDQAGKWVLIELKRSDAASRDAIHEVLKYVEAFKEHMSIREDEIRVLIVSTEWRELLVPFSSFASRVSINVSGLLLRVDSDSRPTSAETVIAIPIKSNRLFAPWHELNLYEDATSMARGLADYTESYRVKGVVDYVIVEMTPHADHISRELAAMAAAHESLVEQGLAREKDLPRFLSPPEYRHLLYFAPLLLDAHECTNAISRAGTKEDVEEATEYIQSMDGDELLCTLHEKLYDVGPKVFRGHFEIGYPAKFGCKLLDEEQWKIERIHRSGRIAANHMLEDSVIIRELRGENGSTGQKYKKRADVKDRSEIAALKSEIADCLEENPSLSHQLRFCIEEALSDSRTEFIEASIFNPSCITLTLFKAATDEQGLLYAPLSTVQARNASDEVISAYFVILEPNGTKPSARRLVRELYDGDAFGILLNLSWGGYDSRDAEVCELIGLTYSVFRLELPNYSASRLSNFKWISAKLANPFQGLNEFMNKNQDFVDDLIRLYSEHWNGFMVVSERGKPFEFRT